MASEQALEAVSDTAMAKKQDGKADRLRVSFVLRGVVAVVAMLALTISGLAIIGAWFPAIPYLGSRGTGAMSVFTLQLVLVPLAACAILAALGLWQTKAGRMLLATGVIILALAAIGMGRMVAVAWQNKVPLPLPHIFEARTTILSPPSSHLDFVTDNSGEKVRFAVYLPAAGTINAPTIAYVHSGGFTGGNYLIRGDDLRWFADQGFLVISISYGLSSDDDHRWDRALGQIGCGLAWISAHAQGLGGDGQRMVLLGDSAGGNLVLNAGYRSAAGTLPVSCDGMAPPIAAIGAIYPVVSVADFHDNPDPEYGPASQLMASRYIGGTPQEFPDRYASVDPLTHLTATAPPALLLHGTNDSTVQIDAAYAVIDRSREIGAPARLITLPLAGHAFDNRTSIGNQIMRQTMRDFFRAELAR